MTLTAERVRQALNYDPETGAITWRIKARNNREIGRPAGCIYHDESGKTYLKISLGGKLYFAHRLIWLHVHGRWPLDEVDHENGNGLDNRLSNLREVPRGQNARNARLRADNSSGFVGVSRHENKWQAKIRINGERKWLGRFESREDAAKAVKQAHTENGFHPNHGTRRPL